MRQLITLTLFVFFCISPAVADERSEVSELVQTNINAIVVLLQDETLDKSSRNQQIIDIVTPIFNYQTMAKLSLGKKHWPTLSPKQQEEFSELFVKRLQQSYLEKLDIYTDEKVLFGEPEVLGNKIHAPTTLIAKDSQIEITYKFYRSQQGWKIYDVEIGGVSVIQTYRSQFDGVLSKGSVDDLLDKLKSDGEFSIPEPEKVQG
ncbi:MAG: ABC transporter substrate-binding protein [Gammaproteobacteria bacterium]|nr:ABC transporter substrate-binding protein [Gammaproteobacteria bacterium]NIR94228.1 ABC transporter substrate-binding protein [Gammaproteobacteria bacterium]